MIDEELAQRIDWLIEHTNTAPEKFLQYAGAETVRKIPKAKAAALIATLERKATEAGLDLGAI
jgi:hypothetical protein